MMVYVVTAGIRVIGCYEDRNRAIQVEHQYGCGCLNKKLCYCEKIRTHNTCLDSKKW